VGRLNWGIADNPAPFQPIGRVTAGDITSANAGARLWLRVERQILRRLERSGAVVFSIRTHITRLDRAIASPAEAQALAGRSARCRAPCKTISRSRRLPSRCSAGCRALAEVPAAAVSAGGKAPGIPRYGLRDRRRRAERCRCP